MTTPWNRRLTPEERTRYERKRYAVLRQPGETKAAHLKRTHFKPSDRGGIPCGEWFCYSEDGLLLAIVSRELSGSGSWSGGLLESEAVKRGKRILKTENFYVVPGDKCEHPQPWRVRHLLIPTSEPRAAKNEAAVSKQQTTRKSRKISRIKRKA